MKRGEAKVSQSWQINKSLRDFRYSILFAAAPFGFGLFRAVTRRDFSGLGVAVASFLGATAPFASASSTAKTIRRN
jgi:hypothetical protein